LLRPCLTFMLRHSSRPALSPSTTLFRSSRGAPPAVTDVIAGRVDSAFMTSISVSEAIISGQVKGVAVTSAKRFPLLPDLPSVSRSEEHTSELQSRVDLVCRLLLEK